MRQSKAQITARAVIDGNDQIECHRTQNGQNHQRKILDQQRCQYDGAIRGHLHLAGAPALFFLQVDGQYANLSLDIRTQAGDPASSVVVSVKPLKDNGTASAVVENEELQGRAACLVLLTPSGEMVAEAKTVIGGG